MRQLGRRCHRQIQVRCESLLMVNGLERRQCLRMGEEVVSGVGITIEPWKIARAHLKPNLMARFEDIRRSPQIDREFVNLSRTEHTRAFKRFTKTRPDNSVSQIPRKSA